MELQHFNPGAAKFGNFINYYQFNPPCNRLKLIPKNLLAEFNLNVQKQPVVALDIGCNAGDLTQDIFLHLTDDVDQVSFRQHCGLHILGVDLDSTLIQRCNENNRYPDNITFDVLDFMKFADQEKCLENYLKSFSKNKFDIVFAFSVTMWIHLNHGDEGLKMFLDSISKITKYLILEPQTWKCYKSAIRRRKRLKEAPYDLSMIKIQQDIENKIDQILLDYRFKQLKQFGTTSWDRTVYLYKNLNFA